MRDEHREQGDATQHIGRDEPLVTDQRRLRHQRSLTPDPAAGPCLLRPGCQQVIGRVAHGRERQAPRREHLHLGDPVAGVADVRDILDVQPPLAHRDARADERAHHRMAERIRLDVRDQHPIRRTMPVELEQRPDRGRLVARLAVGGEVVQSDERAGRGIHRSSVQLRAHGRGAMPLEGS